MNFLKVGKHMINLNQVKALEFNQGGVTVFFSLKQGPDLEVIYFEDLEAAQLQAFFQETITPISKITDEVRSWALDQLAEQASDAGREKQAAEQVRLSTTAKPGR